MITRVQTSRWFEPVSFLLGAVLAFTVWQYHQWAVTPAPELTWGCGPAAGVIPAGVNLPAKPAFNWLLLALQVSVAFAVVVMSLLVAAAAKFVVSLIQANEPHTLSRFDYKPALISQFVSDISNFAATFFGLRAPPVVVW